MNRFRVPATWIALVLAIVGCAEMTGASAWHRDVTLSTDDRPASGSGSGSTQQEAHDAALAAACAQLGLTGEGLNRCLAGQNPGAFSWSMNWDCEMT